jgi:Na+-translocating ferredoxin:NAD+ oxidoreductase RNF subunit RnfB
MIAQILIPVVSMAALGLIFGLGLAYTLKLFGIEVDPTVALIITKLPGTNCGVCGKAGCAGFADALKNGKALLSNCVVSNDEARRSIAEILGIEYNPKVKTTATLLCGGGRNAKDKYSYKGIRSCKAATLVFGGYKECEYGCLGLGDCADVCPFNAIKITEQTLPSVDLKKCTACGNCVKTCPKALFVLTPIKSIYRVNCHSTAKGQDVIRVCKVGCIACGKCVKACPVSAINIKDNLAGIDYNICTNCGECVKACPTHAIVRR